ncbi:Lrp/AsnC ligand binding domain-containing protein [Rhodovulum sp. YNF3179]|uniref:Lrp/AsnC ligand binding domain-containing protein n=1 Tax=Rhodovulum sp. YNF3179 TaxID=3425127 RepID=UPI003D343855
MQCVFVQIRCTPGTTYEVADAIYEREIVSELYSTSGDFDLLAKVYIPADRDVGHYINENLINIPNITRSLTTMTFKAF